MLNIAPALYGQSEKYIELWLYVLKEAHEGKNTFSISELLIKLRLSRQTLSSILNRGKDAFSDIGLDVQIIRKYPTDRYIVISIGKLYNTQINVKKQESKVVSQRNNREPNEQQTMAINAIVTYLNDVTNKQYRVNNTKTKQLILRRISDGFNMEQFKHVIDVKASQWLNTDNDKYLRPETLFGEKFEGYLNETFTNL
jgi:uncharacterized phage protein (TIGR02220 family)